MKKDANKKMLQLTTKIIHPSLHRSFALYNKSVVTCHKIHHSHHNYRSRGCVSKGRCIIIKKDVGMDV